MLLRPVNLLTSSVYSIQEWFGPKETFNERVSYEPVGAAWKTLIAVLLHCTLAAESVFCAFFVSI